jgi:hypothetical protein
LRQSIKQTKMSMKRIMGLSALLMFMVLGAGYAQETPVVDERQAVQKTRIREGVASGEVTRAEAKRLRAEQRNIRRTEHRAEADGTVTDRERARLQRKQNRASRDITRQKHDGQDRPRAN